MNNLNQLALPLSGIVVFGSRPGMGLTRTTLKIANQNAKSKTVVFISYQDYKEKLVYILEQQGEAINQFLSIDTNLNFYKYNFAQDVRELVVRTSPDMIVLDDLDAMLGEEFNLDICYRDTLLKDLQILAHLKKMLIILNVTVSRKAELRGGDKRPLLRDFTWSRNLSDIAEQVYTVYRPEYYNITEDELGDHTFGRIDIELIKDRDCKEVRYILFNHQQQILPIN